MILHYVLSEDIFFPLFFWSCQVYIAAYCYFFQVQINSTIMMDFSVLDFMAVLPFCFSQMTPLSSKLIEAEASAIQRA